MTDREQRIRERAEKIWQDEGQPEGRADLHWDMASELVAIEENQRLAMRPVPPLDADGVSLADEAEPISAVENLGEFPTLTDQGEEQSYPHRRD